MIMCDFPLYRTCFISISYRIFSEANTATGFPLATGESLVIDIAGGQAVYAIGTSVGMDIRYMEAGE